jgi:tight adherence protein B
MDAAGLVLIAIVGLVGLMAIVLVMGDGGKRRLAARARTLRQGLDPIGSRPVTGPRLRRESHTGMDKMINRLVPNPEVLRARLASTGTNLTIGTYGVVCLVLPIVVGGFLLLRGVSPLTSILIGVFAGLWVPHAVVGSMAKGRQKKFIKLFPLAIGLMVRGLKAGLPVSETMIVVGREVSDPVGEEFRRVADQIKLGQTIEGAMWAAARRLNLPDFNFLVITLSVQRETGGNLAETLENLDDILRKREQMKMKVKAMSSEATASAGIIGCLPFVICGIMFVVAPTYISELFTNDLGHMMLAGGALMYTMGGVVMIKMVSFDI